VLEVVETIHDIGGSAVPYDVIARRPGDPPKLVANPSRAEEILGWAAKYDLKDIIRTAYSWHKKR
jgi:UDP-glucose 4-epimerase